MLLIATLALAFTAQNAPVAPQAADVSPYAWFIGSEIAQSSRWRRTASSTATPPPPSQSSRPPGFCPLPVSYCAGAPNSTGAPAVLSFSGSVGVSDNALTLIVTGLPNGALVTLFYGSGRASIPFGDGTLCVDPRGLGYVVRFRVVDLPSFANSLPTMFNFDDPFLPTEALITAGSVYQFQAWYRDPSGGPGGVNFSNALEIEFCP